MATSRKKKKKKEQEEFVAVKSDEESCNKLVESEGLHINRLPMVIDQEAATYNGKLHENHERRKNPPPPENECYNYSSNEYLSTSHLKRNDKTLSSLNRNNKGSAQTEEKVNKYEDHHLGWHRKTRFHVALLGLLIAVVNCYAQATFCIAIVEMVLPADFVFKGESSQTSALKAADHRESQVVVASFAQAGSGSGNPISIGDNSCPVELQYRDYYDSWRYPSTTNSTSKFSNSSNNNNTNPVNGNILDISNRFDWDASRQGLLLGAFAVGTAPLQVLGGRLAEIYGAKWVLFAGCIGTALTNLTIPFLANFSFVLLIMNRVVMGVAQAGMEPGLMCLLAEWMTPTETGFFISMLLFAICIGFFLGSLCSSFLLTLGYGWPMTYYVAGSINLLVSIIWLAYANSRPNESRLISAGELEFIESEQRIAKRKPMMDTSPSKANLVWNLNISQNNYLSQQQINTTKLTIEDSINENATSKKTSQNLGPSRLDSSSQLMKNNNDDDVNSDVRTNNFLNKSEEPASQAPWMNILKTRSVWAFIICKISIRWCADVLSTELPTYLANVLHLSIKLNGIVNSVSSALFAIFSFLTGYIVNRILQNQQKQVTSDEDVDCCYGGPVKTTNISKTNLRKLVQSFASFGAAISLFLMTSYDCNILFSMSMLLVLSCCLVMGTGGELQIPYDMTSKYPGTLHGMACTLSVSGWLAPPLIGLILGDQPSSRYRWSIVWYLTALINLIGGLVFVLFADASPREFDQDSHHESVPKKVDHVKADVVRGRHRPIIEQATATAAAITTTTTATTLPSTGYHNAACKSADDSPPSATRKRLMSVPTCGFTSNGMGCSKEKETWTSNFDSKPIKVRQVQDSFIKPYYLNAFDSVATSVVIFPYRTKQMDLNQPEQQQQGVDWDRKLKLRRVPLAGAAHHDRTGQANPIGRLWSRFWGRRRKFLVEAGDDGLIGSAGALQTRATVEPEANNQMSSAGITIPAGGLQPHYWRQQQKQQQPPDHPVEDEQRRQLEDQLLPRTAVAVSTTKTITHL